MKYFLILNTAVRSLFANKLRSFLTILGIVIGVASVVIMISIGNSASYAVTENIKSLGSNVVFLYSRPTAATNRSLTRGDLEYLKKLPYVKRAVPQINLNLNIWYGSSSENAQITATYPEFEEVRSAHPLIGRFINDADIAAANRVAVIGFNLAKNLFGSENPLGKIIRIGNFPFTVVGVLESKGGQGMGISLDDSCIIPFSTAELRITGNDQIDLISIEAESEAVVRPLVEEIDIYLMKKYKISSDNDKFYMIMSQEDILSTAESITSILTILLAGIASISLIVGGIGIMNIMLVSVTERTREIGIRKAVGAKKKDILMQFLVEAVILCFFGGIIGIVLGIAGSHLIAYYGNWVPVISLSSILLAFGFSAFVGLFFGLYPAYRAANLNPIEALRYE